MDEVKNEWKQALQAALQQAAKQLTGDTIAIQPDDILLQKPPKPEMGDIAVPCFSFAKQFRRSPAQIAQAAAEQLSTVSHPAAQTISVAGPYINILLDLTREAQQLHERLTQDHTTYGRTDYYDGRKIMIEFSCPNTNKPLHLGHLRNDSIGESVARILEANGAQVRKVNLINDRGVHICKSMLAYQKFGEGHTPQSLGMKSDHFVGDFYVRFSQWAKEDPSAEQQAQEMLKKWEDRDEQTMQLWEQMNRWAIEGIQETYEKTGVSFDDIYYESETYSRGRQEVLKGLEQGVFYQEADGSVWVDLDPIGLDKKVLLRKDGTSLYLTQDIGTAVARHDDWPFESLIYVVASEQKYHFTVLFYVLSQLGFPWAERLYHLSYGMVNLPDGKMKSREGTVVDADKLFSQLEEMAKNEIISKEREGEVDDLEKTSEAIAVSALNFYLLQVNPAKDMVFDPKESISFNGNTGPYLQYMGARITSMLKKYADMPGDIDSQRFDPSLLKETEERELLKLLSAFPEVVRQAGIDMNPSAVTAFLYETAKLYSKFYHDHSVLRAESEPLIKARVVLSQMVLQVLKNGFYLVGIPFLESM
ncbi:MAG: arginine--tRNA ligase [Spirochaetota bacterium]